jgi:alpha-galactosidase
MAAVLFNRGNTTANITASFAELGTSKTKSVNVRDLWEDQDRASFDGSYSAELLAHGTVLVRLA